MDRVSRPVFNVLWLNHVKLSKKGTSEKFCIHHGDNGCVRGAGGGVDHMPLRIIVL